MSSNTPCELKLVKLTRALRQTASSPAWARSRSAGHATKKNKGRAGLCRPSPLGRLVEAVVGHILDVVRAQPLTEGRHGVLAVDHLVLDRLHVVATCEVLLDRLLLQLLLRRNGVVAARVAGGAIPVEDALPVLQVCGQGRPPARHSGEEPQRVAGGAIPV